MSMKKKLLESSSQLAEVNGLWEAVLITPGRGSSGLYSEEMLQASGPKAFPKGSHSYVDHPKDASDVRSPKNLLGVLAEDAHYEPGRGLVAKIKVMSHWREFVEEVGPHTGLSIYALSEGDVNDDGDYVIESLIPDTFNTVDLVSYAGRGGALAERLYESAVETSLENEGGNTGVVSVPDDEGDTVELKDVEALLDAKLAPLIAKQDAAAEAAEAEAIADAVEAAKAEAVEAALAKYEADVQAIESANLLASQVTALRKAASEGRDVTEAIESAKVIAAEARGEVQGDRVAEGAAGHVFESAGAPKSVNVGGLF